MKEVWRNKGEEIKERREKIEKKERQDE